jgi:hypothetical protein
MQGRGGGFLRVVRDEGEWKEDLHGECEDAVVQIAASEKGDGLLN